MREHNSILPSNLDLIQQSNGAVSDYDYDLLNRLTNLKHFVDSGDDLIRDAIEPVLANFHYVLTRTGTRPAPRKRMT